MPEKTWKYFTLDEFKCPCCGTTVVEFKLIDLLDQARALLKKPIAISSAYRCKKHNAEVGGKKNSAHLMGQAADIPCPDDRYRFKLYDTLRSVGFTRIGVGNGFLHADISGTLPQEVMFDYYE